MDLPDDPSRSEFDSLGDGPPPRRRGPGAFVVAAAEVAVAAVLFVAVWLTASRRTPAARTRDDVRRGESPRPAFLD